MTRTPLSRSKGQKSTCRGRGILWRPPAQLAIVVVIVIVVVVVVVVVIIVVVVTIFVVVDSDRCHTLHCQLLTFCMTMLLLLR